MPLRYRFLAELANEKLAKTPYGLYVWKGKYDIGCKKRGEYLHKREVDRALFANVHRKACTEVEVLRRKVAEGRHCTICHKKLPYRCEACEKAAKESKAYSREMARKFREEMAA